ncbi:MAG: hypothetical protein KDA77_24210 [Planctomycetaceae bacterium]|nr:hypothetical protein [Planctomycetaceae bacterium]
MIFGLLLALNLFPEILNSPVSILIYSALVVILTQFCEWLVFRKSVSQLKVIEKNESIKNAIEDQQRNQNHVIRWISNLAALLLVIFGFFVLASETHPDLASVSIAMGVAYLLISGYTMLQKSK